MRASAIPLSDDGLAPIVDALPRNRHLYKLDITCNLLTPEFERERLLPAVRANTGLRELILSYDSPIRDEIRELLETRPPRS